ncbi:ABC transporter ATP-binding protein [Methylobrevis pamukkalensis]|uniref:Spermidine/putrescine import ATP-binding protein PotA n=1 Tax=Methylobrevis pamukkalensis TaxID=1439726 RepID=A0A1E3H1J1_9HYPH|nr:ABC transporter ATP-binding protein [Methylobrevis pamukkalensis]ODN70177.1 Spermidine/putrescine import ATP-binding protein PotA [Methylobrevis pamukkalensis]
MAFLELSHVKKSFGQVHVVKDFDMAIEKGEFISFLGPSGCGKTTVLRMIAGFETVSSGTITIGGHDLTDLKPNQRNIGMVFQAYALFPNMTVGQNVAFGLKVAGKPKAEIDVTVKEMLDLIHLGHLIDRFPYQLSGGQQQRVALARALAIRPRVLLLDEPLSALDAKIRVSLREEIRSIQRKLGITTIFVTHDQEEALSISDRIVVMNEGRADQIGTPFEIYNFPRTRFVASFVGTLNILPGHVADGASGRIEIDGQAVHACRDLARLTGRSACTVALRPEAIRLGTAGDGANHLTGKIEEVSFLGAVLRVRVRLADHAISLDMFNNPGVAPPERGSPATVTFAREDVLIVEEAA